jgi:site-specific DNA-methyltransferase (adenine-specific)
MMDEVKRILKENGTVWINLGDTYGNSPKLSKCQLLLPHRFAIGCMERGWIIRNDIIWAIRNKKPESAKDRFTRKHEYIFFMVKNRRYYFDLDSIREVPITAGSKRKDFMRNHKNGKNPGDVSDFWDINKKKSVFNHFATFSTHLITKPIIAGSPENGIILDPFCGSGTTLVHALELGRRFIGIDGKKEYCRIAEDRIGIIKEHAGNHDKLP